MLLEITYLTYLRVVKGFTPPSLRHDRSLTYAMSVKFLCEEVKVVYRIWWKCPGYFWSYYCLHVPGHDVHR